MVKIDSMSTNSKNNDTTTTTSLSHNIWINQEQYRPNNFKVTNVNTSKKTNDNNTYTKSNNNIGINWYNSALCNNYLKKMPARYKYFID